MKPLIMYDDAIGALNPTISAYMAEVGTHPDFLKDENPWSRVGAPMALLGDWFRFDFGEPLTCIGAGIINHNTNDIPTTHSVRVGTIDDGTSYDLAAISFGWQANYNYEPNQCGFFDAGPITRRYWYLVNGLGVNWRIGGVFLARASYEFDETPDAPLLDEPHAQVVSGHTEGGSRRRQRRGEPFRDRHFRWRRTTKEMVEALQAIAVTQGGRRHPFLYVHYDHPDLGNPATSPPGYYVADYCRLTGLRAMERKPGGGYGLSLGMEVILGPDRILP